MEKGNRFKLAAEASMPTATIFRVTGVKVRRGVEYVKGEAEGGKFKEKLDWTPSTALVFVSSR